MSVIEKLAANNETDDRGLTHYGRAYHDGLGMKAGLWRMGYELYRVSILGVITVDAIFLAELLGGFLGIEADASEPIATVGLVRMLTCLVILFAAHKAYTYGRRKRKENIAEWREERSKRSGGTSIDLGNR